MSGTPSNPCYLSRECIKFTSCRQGTYKPPRYDPLENFKYTAQNMALWVSMLNTVNTNFLINSSEYNLMIIPWTHSIKENRDFFIQTLGLGIYHEFIFSIWISEKQWSPIGDWPLGEPMSGWRPTIRGRPSCHRLDLTVFRKSRQKKPSLKHM